MIWTWLIMVGSYSASLVLPAEPIRAECVRFVQDARAPDCPDIYAWVESEIFVPSGPAGKGSRYRHAVHPVSSHWFRAISSRKWSRYAITGPQQNGKSLMGYVLPALYHVFVQKECVLVGVPDMKMARDKWMRDFRPVIVASSYRDELPSTGEGSKGGPVRSVIFRSGGELCFMSAGGGDKNRAGATSRVLAATEVDGYDTAGEESREADPLSQMEGRLNAFGLFSSITYMECTVSIEAGRIWREVHQGTGSMLYRRCPYCEEFVSPDREHLRGWSAAENEREAGELAHFVCPLCEHPWTEEDRRETWAETVLVHRGQTIDAGGTVHGPEPETYTFGLRWSAIDHPFKTVAELGIREWLGRNSKDRQGAEKALRQWYWALPWIPDDITLTPLDPDAVAARQTGLPRGIVPDNAAGVVVGTDTGKRQLDWVAIAVLPAGGARVIDYGEQPVDWERLGTTEGLRLALRQLDEYFVRAWRRESGGAVAPSQVWIDSGYAEHQAGVYAFCLEKAAGVDLGAEVYRPTKGSGSGPRLQQYRPPNRRGGDIRYLGDRFHFQYQRQHRLSLVHLDGDEWKYRVQERFAMPADEPLALLLFDAASPSEHAEYADEIAAEQWTEKYSRRRGTYYEWVRIRRKNHKLDATYSALAAAAFVAIEFEKQDSQQQGNWFAQMPARKAA